MMLLFIFYLSLYKVKMIYIGTLQSVCIYIINMIVSVVTTIGFDVLFIVFTVNVVIGLFSIIVIFNKKKE